MALPEHILLTYGSLLLFCWVLVEQFGIPLPATPVLLAAGGLSADHKVSFSVALLAGLLACLVADTSWFLIGRRYGHHVLRVLCTTISNTSIKRSWRWKYWWAMKQSRWRWRSGSARPGNGSSG